MSWFQSRLVRRLVFIGLLTLFATWLALPASLPVKFRLGLWQVDRVVQLPRLAFSLFGKPVSNTQPIKLGLDLQCGMQVVLMADMTDIAPADQEDALLAAQEIIRRRVDLYGVNEPVVQTSRAGDEYRLIVELPGIANPQEALALVGRTAELEFRLEGKIEERLDPSQPVYLINEQQFQATGLTGRQLRKASVQFDQNTGEPLISLQFNDEGSQLFAQITTDHVGKRLGIFIDGAPVTLPQIAGPIPNGQAVITGGFTLEQAKQLAIQLNAGALPVPISVLEQRTVGASLGEVSIRQSVFAGVVGLALVALFMVLNYGFHGGVAGVALSIYAVLTVALYKMMGVTLTLPGIAGLLLSVGMAVDANILIFERFKEEFRLGHTYRNALELGFGRAWESIKDANLATILTALVLINPLNLDWLARSGLVRGFGITLLIGVLLSLFTGVVVSRNLLRAAAPWLEKLYIKGRKS